jgi:hypothetical protein
MECRPASSSNELVPSHSSARGLGNSFNTKARRNDARGEAPRPVGQARGAETTQSTIADGIRELWSAGPLGATPLVVTSLRSGVPGAAETAEQVASVRLLSPP